MKATGIRSEQTIYRILDDHQIERRPRLKGVTKIGVVLELDVAKILVKIENKSAYINEAVRYYYNRE